MKRFMSSSRDSFLTQGKRSHRFTIRESHWENIASTYRFMRIQYSGDFCTKKDGGLLFSLLFFFFSPTFSGKETTILSVNVDIYTGKQCPTITAQYLPERSFWGFLHW